MPSIHFADQTITCETGANLRRVLLDHNLPLYNAPAHIIHCRGFGTCGTCAVRIKGPITQMTKVERWRLNIPPHQQERGRRLACQCKVLGDLSIEKYEGLWGHKDQLK